MKKIVACTALGLFLFLAAGVNLFSQTFSWEVKFLRGAHQDSVPISRQIRMQTGDMFKLAITPDTDCFSYVVFYGSSREVSILWDTPLTAGNEVNIGPYALVAPSGIETIYVIMSLTRQTNLESLILDHNNNPDSRQRSNNLYREVISLQTAASNLGEPASSFISSGGTTRGSTALNDSPGVQVTRFSQKDMYVRAITIRH